MLSTGRNSPIVVLSVSRGSEDALQVEETGSGLSLDNHEVPMLSRIVDAVTRDNALHLPLDDHTRRVQQILERRRRRLAKVRDSGISWMCYCEVYLTDCVTLFV